MPLLNEAIVVDNVVIRIVLILKFLILSLIAITNLIGWKLLGLVLIFVLGSSLDLVLEVNL